MGDFWRKEYCGNGISKYVPDSLFKNTGSSIDSNVYKLESLGAVIDLGGQKHFDELYAILGDFTFVVYTHLDADHIGLPTGKPHYASNEAISHFLKNKKQALDYRFTVSIDDREIHTGKQCNVIISKKLFGDLGDIKEVATELRPGMQDGSLYFKRYDSGHAMGQVVYFFNGYAFTGDLMANRKRHDVDFSPRVFASFIKDTVGGMDLFLQAMTRIISRA